MADGLAGELKELAERGINRTFQELRGKPPLDLPILFEIVGKLYSDFESFGEQQKVGAIEGTILQALKLIPNDPIHESEFESSSVTLHQAVLRLYELADVPDEFEDGQ